MSDTVEFSQIIEPSAVAELSFVADRSLRLTTRAYSGGIFIGGVESHTKKFGVRIKIDDCDIPGFAQRPDSWVEGEAFGRDSLGGGIAFGAVNEGQKVTLYILNKSTERERCDIWVQLAKQVPRTLTPRPNSLAVVGQIFARLAAAEKVVKEARVVTEQSAGAIDRTKLCEAINDYDAVAKP